MKTESKNGNKGKGQHYVPACYLANFGTDGNKGRNSKVYFINKRELKLNCSNVESFPKENCFYDVDAPEEKKHVVDDMYTRMEGEYSTLLKKLISLVVLEPSERMDQKVMLTKDDKGVLAAYLSMQITRTRAFRDRIQGIYQQIKDGFPWVPIPSYTDKDYRRVHIRVLLESNSMHFFANMFEDRNWVFYINHTDVPFFTSDNPIIAIDYDAHHRSPKSAAHPMLGYYFPLTPQIAIGFFDKKKVFCDMCYMDIYKEEDIVGYNGELLRQSTRFVFSDTDFRTIKCLMRRAE